MNEEANAAKLYVAINTAEASRCTWCGAPCIRNPERIGFSTYCSSDCDKANNADIYQNRAIFSFLGAVFSIAIAYLEPLMPIFSLALFPYSIYSYIQHTEAEKIRETIPQNSRYDEGSVELLLLTNSAQRVQCPNCEQGSIDLSTIDEDMVYHCEFCGVSGAVEILTSEGKTRN